MKRFQSLGNDLIYSPSSARVYDVTNGSVRWLTATPSSGLGAVAGTYVVFVSGTRLVHEPR